MIILYFSQDLPQTLDDGENFGADQQFWDIPCFKKYRNHLNSKSHEWLIIKNVFHFTGNLNQRIKAMPNGNGLCVSKIKYK